MRSTPGQRQSAWKHRGLFGVLLVLVAISCSRSGQAGQQPAGRRGQPDRCSDCLAPFCGSARGAGVLPARTGCRHPGGRWDR